MEDITRALSSGTLDLDQARYIRGHPLLFTECLGHIYDLVLVGHSKVLLQALCNLCTVSPKHCSVLLQWSITHIHALVSKYALLTAALLHTAIANAPDPDRPAMRTSTAQHVEVLITQDPSAPGFEWLCYLLEDLFLSQHLALPSLTLSSQCAVLQVLIPVCSEGRATPGLVSALVTHLECIPVPCPCPEQWDLVASLLECLCDASPSVSATQWSSLGLTTARLLQSLAPAPDHTYLLKTLAMRLVCNGVQTQEFREAFIQARGVDQVLGACRIDDQHPYIREWAVVALRYLTEEDHVRQHISSLEVQGVDQTSQEELARLGLHLDPDGMTGALRLRNLD